MSKYSIAAELKLWSGLIALSFSLSLFSGVVFAEAADRDKPIDLEADTVTVDDAKQTSTYTGNVILTQGTLVIRADKLIVREDKDGFQHSTSLGNPTTFRQKREGKNEYMEGSAQRIEYDGRMDKVQLYTKAWVKRGEDIVHGNYIMYDANAEYAEVIGGTKSDNTDRSSGRVRAIIQPKSKKTSEPVSSPVSNPGADKVKPAEPGKSEAPANKTTVEKPEPQPASGNSSPLNKNMRFSRNLELGAAPK